MCESWSQSVKLSYYPAEMDKADLDDLLSRLKEIEELLRFPAVQGHVNRAETLALSIARRVKSGPTSHLAMQVISEANALRPGALPIKPDDGKRQALIAKLRLALEAERDKP
jgi:hypothetical protein